MKRQPFTIIIEKIGLVNETRKKKSILGKQEVTVYLLLTLYMGVSVASTTLLVTRNCIGATTLRGWLDETGLSQGIPKRTFPGFGQAQNTGGI